MLFTKVVNFLCIHGSAEIRTNIKFWIVYRCIYWVNNTFILVACVWVLLQNNKSIYIMSILDIGIMVKVFANGPGDLGSIPDQIIPKTQKMVLDSFLLNTQHYKVRIKGKVEQSRERSSTLPWCSSYRKGNHRVTLDCSCQLYLLTWYNDY